MSLLLNGTSQYLSLASSLVSGGLPYSAVGWFKSTSATVNQDIVSFGSHTTVNPLLRLELNGATAGRVAAQQRDDAGVGGAIANDSAAYTINVWQHAGAVFISGTNRSAFLNGANKGTNSSAMGTTTTTRSAIGALLRSTAVGFFSGRLAHVSVWSVALADADFASLAAGALPSSVQAANLLAYLPLTSDFTDTKGNVWTNNGSATIDGADNPTVSGGAAIFRRGLFNRAGSRGVPA